MIRILSALGKSCYSLVALVNRVPNVVSNTSSYRTLGTASLSGRGQKCNTWGSTGELRQAFMGRKGNRNPVWLLCAYPWKTSVLEAKAFSAHLRRFFAQTKPLAFGRKTTNMIILKSDIKWGLFNAYLLYDLIFSRYRIFPY
jgi:hypothetical protein